MENSVTEEACSPEDVDDATVIINDSSTLESFLKYVWDCKGYDKEYRLSVLLIFRCIRWVHVLTGESPESARQWKDRTLDGIDRFCFIFILLQLKRRR